MALTAHAMKGADKECAEAGIDGYMTKPIDREQLRACISANSDSTQLDESEAGDDRLAV